MGYESKIDRLLGDSDKAMRACVLEIWHDSHDEYYKREKEFQSGLSKIMDDYSRDKFNKFIGTGYYQKAWNKFSAKKKEKILSEIEPILLYGKQFSDNMNAKSPVEFVFLETANKLVLYCNGMFSTTNEGDDIDDDHNRRIRAFMKTSYTTIKCEELNKYAEENEKFPIWLNELTFIEPILNKSRKLKI